MAIGLVASMIGIFMVKRRPARTTPSSASTGIYIAQAISIVGAGALAFGYVGSPTPPTVASCW
jgi:Na+/H+-translocating membrane pyrophosphatase